MGQLRCYHAADLVGIAAIERNDPDQVNTIERSLHSRLLGRSIRVPGIYAAVSREWYSDVDDLALDVLGHIAIEENGSAGWVTPDVWIFAVKPWEIPKLYS